ncbi:hypothetical protein Tco_0736242 [Tanacetum coccineum]
MEWMVEPTASRLLIPVLPIIMFYSKVYYPQGVICFSGKTCHRRFAPSESRSDVDIENLFKFCFSGVPIKGGGSGKLTFSMARIYFGVLVLLSMLDERILCLLENDEPFIADPAATSPLMKALTLQNISSTVLGILSLSFLASSG